MPDWDALHVRIWAVGLDAEYELDQLLKHWGDWIAGMPTSDPFDWMQWRHHLLRAMLGPPNPFLPVPYPPHGIVVFDPPQDSTPDSPYLYPDEYFQNVHDQWRLNTPPFLDPGEVLPPDTNHGGDRIPGRYA